MTTHALGSVRAGLLREGAAFVRAAAALPGVVRIAIIGSLTTDRVDPKDIDLLVTVADEADLVPLAAAARRLQGRAQSIGAGADVFLADPAGRYLGRTCLWRHCGPGWRASCDAWHCGRRPYLHDDLNTVCLAPALVVEPPLELHPAVVRRVKLPADLEAVATEFERTAVAGARAASARGDAA
jgi:predicted nucleotidyltransferase